MDDILREVRIAVATDDRTIDLSCEEAVKLVARFPELGREARKWRLTTGGPGRLIVIDDEIIAAFQAEHRAEDAEKARSSAHPGSGGT